LRKNEKSRTRERGIASTAGSAKQKDLDKTNASKRIGTLEEIRRRALVERVRFAAGFAHSPTLLMEEQNTLARQFGNEGGSQSFRDSVFTPITAASDHINDAEGYLEKKG
jgi:hypothetical protein